MGKVVRWFQEEATNTLPRTGVEANFQDREAEEVEVAFKGQLRVEDFQRKTFIHLGRLKREHPLPWHNFKERRLNLGQKGEKLGSQTLHPLKLLKVRSLSIPLGLQ